MGIYWKICIYIYIHVRHLKHNEFTIKKGQLTAKPVWYNGGIWWFLMEIRPVDSTVNRVFASDNVEMTLRQW